MQKKWTLAIVIVAVSLIVATALAVNQKQNSNPLAQNREFTPEKPVASSSRPSSACCGAQSSGCGVNTGVKAGSCCSGQGNGTATKPREMLQALESYLYRVYSARLEDPQISVEVQDLGCHMEALIKKGDTVVKRLSISGNTITEIS